MMKRTRIDAVEGKKVEGTNAIEYLRIQGASCASCVGKIEGALNQVAGVEKAVMNLVQSTVSVTGDAPVESLIEAVKQAGYEAESVTDSSDQSVLDEKEKADELYYKRLMKEMWIALSLGIPLMIYSLVVGEM
ncbi:MAG: Cu+-exporting ATPase, partial [Halioglobus sp.]